MESWAGPGNKVHVHNYVCGDVFGLWTCVCVCGYCVGVGGRMCMCVYMSETLSGREKVHCIIARAFTGLQSSSTRRVQMK